LTAYELQNLPCGVALDSNGLHLPPRLTLLGANGDAKPLEPAVELVYLGVFPGLHEAKLRGGGLSPVWSTECRE